MNIKNESISIMQVAYSMLAVAIVFALTVVIQLIGQKMLGEGVIAIIYLVPIGWCTVRWGQIAGVSAAITAALSFDFLFIPPYYTFNIGSLEGWLLLFIFIGASILVVGRIQSILGEMQNRERKAAFLYEMIASFANQQTREGIARALADQIQQKYLAEFVQINLEGKGQLSAKIISAANDANSSAKGRPDRALPIFSGSALVGVIAIWKGLIPLPSEDDPMLQTLLRQTAIALDRAQITEENGQSAPGHNQEI